MRKIIKTLAVTLLGALFYTSAHAGDYEERDRKNGIAIYAGVYSPDVFTDIVFSPQDTKTDDIQLVYVTYLRRLARLTTWLDLELEGGVGRRFGDNDSVEASLALVARVTKFPWNDVLRTTLGVSLLGPSYVNKLSPQEISKDGREAHWLNYFALELTFALPSAPQYETFFKLHHRSGMFGLIQGSTNGADFISAGFRYRF
ncbi:hypothetical protein IAI18_12210 [Acetobacteraceae bacterium H6797]|nr:hypothetical protein [Acetobacteraceae bacterium H6797]